MLEASFLFDPASGTAEQAQRDCPGYFVDLNLNQVEDAIFKGRERYDLKNIFRLPLRDVRDVVFRQAILRDLEKVPVRLCFNDFFAGLGRVRECQAKIERVYYSRQKEWWLLEAVRIYGQTVSQLKLALAQADICAVGLSVFLEYLQDYAGSKPFTDLTGAANRLQEQLKAVRYTVLIRGLRVTVHNEVDSRDYGTEILEVFDRFRQADVGRHAFECRDDLEMNSVEAQVLEGVAQLNAALFSQIRQFFGEHQSFVDVTVERGDRELQFYVAYLDYLMPLRALGLTLTHPSLLTARTTTKISRGFDIALAQKLQSSGGLPVLNDVEFTASERIIVVSGPNQGGKTTFTRMVGQIHYLAALGLLVPAAAVELEVCDEIFTHFEREEKIQNRRGKLEDDVLRIHEILEVASEKSLVLINEMFTSTALRDAVFLSRNVARLLLERHSRCVWVTFLDEISRLSPETVSMTSMVKSENTAERTFEVVRRPADGHAFAMSIAQKHGLTFDNIRERVAHESASSLSG